MSGPTSHDQSCDGSHSFFTLLLPPLPVAIHRKAQSATPRHHTRRRVSSEYAGKGQKRSLQFPLVLRPIITRSPAGLTARVTEVAVHLQPEPDCLNSSWMKQGSSITPLKLERPRQRSPTPLLARLAFPARRRSQIYSVGPPAVASLSSKQNSVFMTIPLQHPFEAAIEPRSWPVVRTARVTAVCSPSPSPRISFRPNPGKDKQE